MTKNKKEEEIEFHALDTFSKELGYVHITKNCSTRNPKCSKCYHPINDKGVCDYCGCESSEC